jgi:wobble nucleotide-excising tRNase
VATENLRKWEALKAKESEPIKSAVATYQTAEKRRAEIVKEKEKAQSDLKAFALKAIGTRQAEINELLSNFGANFTVVDAKANFVGREPNTDYAIAVGANKIKVGEHSDTEPSFKTVLSAGDKTTLALAFFISQVKADPQLADAIVVFDDPFNSQDIYRQFETTSQIRAVAEAATQTIVLSHDPRFLDMIEKNADSAVVGTFQMLCSDTGEGAISAWSAADELKDLYVKRAQEIQEYAGRGKLLKGVTALEIVQGMRPFLEDYLRARYPGRFADQDMLFGMVDVIKQAGNDDPMSPSVADLLSLNEYTRPEHHGGGKQPDPIELRAQCKKIVKIIGAY